MAVLDLVWFASLGLSALSLATMLVLVGRRRIVDKRVRRDKGRSAELLTGILDHLEPDGGGFPFANISARDRELVGGLVGEVMRLVRGDDLARLTELLRGLGTVESAQAKLKNGSDHQREQAAETLANFPDPAVLEALDRALDDGSARVRLAAAVSLSHCGHPPRFDRIVEAMGRCVSGSQSRRLRTLYREVAAAHPDQAVALAGEALEPATRVLIIDALGGIGDYRVLPALLAAARDADMEVRAAGFRSLSQLGHPAAAAVVAEGLRDAAWPVRAQAALCVGQIDLAEMVPELERLLGDPEWWVRFRAAEALFDLGEEGREVLAALRDEATPAGNIAQLILAEKRAAP